MGVPSSETWKNGWTGGLPAHSWDNRTEVNKRTICKVWARVKAPSQDGTCSGTSNCGKTWRAKGSDSSQEPGEGLRGRWGLRWRNTKSGWGKEMEASMLWLLSSPAFPPPRDASHWANSTENLRLGSPGETVTKQPPRTYSKIKKDREGQMKSPHGILVGCQVGGCWEEAISKSLP